MLDVRQARQIYQLMGKLFEPGDGRRIIIIISPAISLRSCLAVRRKKRRKLYNGMLSCALYVF